MTNGVIFFIVENIIMVAVTVLLGRVLSVFTDRILE